MSNIFITGATGFLGSYLTRLLLTEKNSHVYMLLRKTDSGSVTRRRKDLIKRMPTKAAQRKIASRLHAVDGDISKPDMGLGRRDFLKLQNRIDEVYHCAAVRDFGWAIRDIRAVNVKGTENVLKAALTWKKNGVLRRVHHISTAYVAGNYKKIFRETQLDVGQGFNNTYEQTKFEAEKIVVKYRRQGLPVDVYRPSIITDSARVQQHYISLPLRFLMILVMQVFREIPVDRTSTLNLIPIDAAAEAIYLISKDPECASNRNYHIVNPWPVRFTTLLDISSRVFRFQKPRLVSRAKFNKNNKSAVQKKLVEVFIPYLNQRPCFDMSEAYGVFRKNGFTMPRMTRAVLTEKLRAYRACGMIPDKGSRAFGVSGSRYIRRS